MATAGRAGGGAAGGAGGPSLDALAAGIGDLVAEVAGRVPVDEDVAAWLSAAPVDRASATWALAEWMVSYALNVEAGMPRPVVTARVMEGAARFSERGGGTDEELVRAAVHAYLAAKARARGGDK